MGQIFAVFAGFLNLLFEELVDFNFCIECSRDEMFCSENIVLKLTTFCFVLLHIFTKGTVLTFMQ